MYNDVPRSIYKAWVVKKNNANNSSKQNVMPARGWKSLDWGHGSSQLLKWVERLAISYCFCTQTHVPSYTHLFQAQTLLNIKLSKEIMSHTITVSMSLTTPTLDYCLLRNTLFPCNSLHLFISFNPYSRKLFAFFSSLFIT